MKPIRVTNIQHGCVNDGPGVRTTVFLKGCPLRCPWCCNPETQSYEEQYYVSEDKCLLSKGQQSILCNHCERNGGERSVYSCPFSVYECVSKDYTIDQLFHEIIKDKYIYDSSGGGVTFSGGEPLLQAECLVSLLEKLKGVNINIAFETSLVTPDNIIILRNYVDLWIVDLKLQPEMMLNDNDYLLNMKSLLEKIKERNYRLVYIHSMHDKQAEISERLLTLGVHHIELLQAHHLGQKKYEKLKREVTDYTANLNEMKCFAEYLRQKGIDTKTLSI